MFASNSRFASTPVCKYSRFAITHVLQVLTLRCTHICKYSRFTSTHDCKYSYFASPHVCKYLWLQVLTFSKYSRFQVSTIYKYTRFQVLESECTSVCMYSSFQVLRLIYRGRDLKGNRKYDIEIWRRSEIKKIDAFHKQINVIRNTISLEIKLAEALWSIGQRIWQWILEIFLIDAEEHSDNTDFVLRSITENALVWTH